VARHIFSYPDPDRCVIGTVGMPGERTFFLQVRQGSDMTSVVIEKSQVQALAERVDQVLDEARDQRGAAIPERGVSASTDTDPLELPIVEEFRVGALALGWDETAEEIVVEAHAMGDDEVPDIGDDDGSGADTVRIWLNPVDARAFAQRARSVVLAGRPSCPFCGQPLDPEGHICPRANGYRRR
jgi:uncharacterized repeat protein (TIGR03847 family)